MAIFLGPNNQSFIQLINVKCVTCFQVTRYGGSPTDTFRLRVDTADTSSLTYLKDGFAQNVSGTCGTLSFDPYEKVCIFECQCSKNTPSFDAFEQKCIAENVLKKDCNYVSGSWSWHFGWNWDGEENSLPILDVQSYGLTAAINVSAKLYDKCTITFGERYSKDGLWKPIDLRFSEEENVVFFELHEMWHFTWIISAMNDSEKHNIEASFLRIHITCINDKASSHEIALKEISSCFVLKTTGNVTYKYTNKCKYTKTDKYTKATAADKRTTTTSIGKDKTKSSVNILTWIGVSIGLVVVLFVVLFILYCFLIKKCGQSTNVVGIKESVKFIRGNNPETSRVKFV
ncbi:uncharacterized protein LOC124444456 [Xenia sp. Carnegie-2017]|uniref:uncharacterized protein LOC124444456 n=1 Tax=Xenia sp. Carnegie-2017 TaxID=2897299 RepID=UPI001F043DC7|nr:uncharacterized protein LOC124444456 [Xenia sp. Carnegie-2017]